MSSVISVPETDFAAAISTGKPTLVDFWAAWCGPCKQLSPIVDKIAEEHPEYTIVKVDIEAAPEVAAQFSITSIPRVIVYNAAGEVTADFTGVKPKRVLLDELAKA